MSRVCVLFLILLSAVSCHYTDKVKDPEPVKDSIGNAALVASGLSPKDFLHYHNACQRFFETTLPGSSFNGSILVAKKGSILFEQYQGYTDPFLKQDSINPKVAFHLASVSKTFTAMATLKLWEQGKLGLDDTLNKYFPDFPYTGITIKMLLNHRSGIPNYLHYLDHYKWDKRKMVTNADVLRSLYDYRPPLDFTSGKHFAYCNTNYVLLALIIERVSGMSFKTFLETTFFRPLQMNDSYVFTPEDVTRSLPSFQYNNKRFPYEFLDIVYGDKNIYSTVRDMLKWDQALYAGKLFAKNTLDSAFSPYSFEKSGMRNYGLGWRMTLLPNGKKMLYHNGWWHGNNTVFIRLVEEEVAIIVLSNKFNRNIYSTKNLCNLFGNYMQNAEFEE